MSRRFSAMTGWPSESQESSATISARPFLAATVGKETSRIRSRKGAT